VGNPLCPALDCRPQEQDLWEVQRLQYKGHTALFHEIKPDFKEYFDFLTVARIPHFFRQNIGQQQWPGIHKLGS
jgi:hypothetical protein